MTLLSLLLTLAIIGLVVYLITLISMPEPIRTIIIAVAVLVCIIYVLEAFGVVGQLGLPKLRL